MTVAQCTVVTEYADEPAGENTACPLVATWVLTTGCVHEHSLYMECCTVHAVEGLRAVEARAAECGPCAEAPDGRHHSCQAQFVSLVPLGPVDAEIDPAAPPVLIPTN